jgi:hypothetical protein
MQSAAEYQSDGSEAGVFFSKGSPAAAKTTLATRGILSLWSLAWLLEESPQARFADMPAGFTPSRKPSVRFTWART